MFAKIYKPSKTSMQSGLAQTKKWILEFNSEKPKTIEPLMGWTSSLDTKEQIKLSFTSLQDAILYAKKNNIKFEVVKNNVRKYKPKAYSDNFNYNRLNLWTH